MQLAAQVEDETDAGFEKHSSIVHQIGILIDFTVTRDMGYKVLETFSESTAGLVSHMAH